VGLIAALGFSAKMQFIMIEIALYKPDIAPNTATIARLCACFGLKLTIIEPAGFAFTDSSFRRAGMDYLEHVEIHRANSWAAFQAQNAAKRIVLLSTKASQSHVAFQFAKNDILLLGRESAGVPEDVHAALPHRIKIPMQQGFRSLNVAMAASLVAGEALRQLGAFERLTL
jgi:tRNA (cytidine/uridine-2'-O-)-methyltransferase